MTRPRTSILVVGYPLVTVPLFLMDGFVGYVFTDSQGFGWGTLLALLFAGWLAKCSGEASRHRAKQREWNALDPDYRPRRPLLAAVRLIVRLIVAAPIVLGCFWLFVNFDDPSSPARLITLVAAVAIPALWIAGLLLHRRKRRPTSHEWIVTQAITRSLPAPSVAEAYAQLPDYCRPLLTREH